MSHPQFRIAVALLCLGSAAFTGCAKSGGSSSDGAKGGTKTSTGRRPVTVPTAVNAIVIFPDSPIISTGATITFSASGGSGPLSYVVQSGGGTIDSQGRYTAPGTAGTATVRAIDTTSTSYADALVTIQSVLTLTPSTITLAPGANQPFAAAGGSGGYVYTIITGGGTINTATGSYTASLSTGSTLVQVRDTLGSIAQATVTVADFPLAITPATKTIPVNYISRFAASGGQGPYLFSVFAGGGTVNASTGSYTAPAAPGSATVRVKDAKNATIDAVITINAALTLSPATDTLAVGNTQVFTAAGGVGPYLYSIASGGGTINSSTGSYTAPAVTGNAVVQVKDSLNTIAQSTVTIQAALAISPATLTLTPGRTSTFTATGGVGADTYSLLSGAGVIDPNSGLYTAPAASGTDVVRATDTRGNTSDSTITINPSLGINPASFTLAAGNPKSFAGTNGVPPYSFSVFSGGGSIVSGSGAYTAPGASGAVTVRVTDNIGNFADSAVTINSALQISPATLTLAVNNTQTFTVTGGVGPFSYSRVSGTGTISLTTGQYVAPASAGTALVQATDSLGNTSNATITINAALQISPSSVSLAVTNTTTFTAAGGVTPYTYSVFSGGGSINATNGSYTAPGASGSATVRVTDSFGNTSDSLVTVQPALALSPSTTTLTLGATQSFAASGGVTPYLYSKTSGGGSIDASTGLYTAPGSPGSASVLVTDARGNTSPGTITINPSLAISPITLTTTVGQNTTFSATGGTGSNAYSLVSGSGTIAAATGIYTAPASPGTDRVRVTDSRGNTSDATLTINATLGITPTSFTLAAGNSKSFAATGGVSPFTFSILSGGGSIASSTGIYTAPGAAGSATVRVTDSVGTTADSGVTINAAFQISPASSTLAVNNIETFAVTGGVSPFSYTQVSGGGSIGLASGQYVAPAVSGSAVVRATDNLGNTSDAAITINAALQISPSSFSLAVSNVTTFTATGGVTPYAFSVFSGGGSVNSSTGSYTAPNTAGSATLRVTDAFGNTSDSLVTIQPALAISPGAPPVGVNTSQAFSSSGGVSPYTYSKTSGGGSINSSTGLYSAPATVGTAVVTVTDARSNTSSATITINPSLAISPTPTFVNKSGSRSFTAAGGAPPYVYSVFSGGGSVNSSTGAYSAPATTGSATVRVTDAQSTTSDSTVSITDALAIVPTAFTLAVNNTKTFAVTGGQAPYSYTVAAGAGSINSSSGLYTAPATSGSATVRVTDTFGVTADSAVTINPALAITPTSISVPLNGTQTFSSTGGVGASAYSVVAGGGSINSSTGVYTAPNAAGSVTVRASDAYSNTADSSVTVYVQVASAANSSITGSGPVTANGIATSTATLTLIDTLGNAINGVTPTFSATDTGSTNAYGACSATNSSGVSTCTLTSTHAETKTLAITGPVAKSGGPVSFVAGSASSSTSTLVASASGTVVANGTSSSTITVTLKDAFGNAVSGASTTFASTGTGNTLVQPASTTDASGVATGSLKSTVAEAKTVSIASPAGLSSVTAGVTFVAGPPSSSTSTIAASTTETLGSVTDDGVNYATVTITLRDAQSNRISGTTVGFTSSGTGNTLVQPSSATNASGQATGQIRSTVAETKLLAISSPSGLTSVTTNLTFASTTASAGQCSIAGTGPVQANGTSTSTVSITLKNAGGVALVGVIPTFGATDTEIANVYGTCSVTNSSGVSTCTLASLYPETKTLQTKTPLLNTGGSVIFTSIPRNLEVPIELLDSGLTASSTSAVTWARTRTSLDTTDYDGSPAYYFGANCTNTGAVASLVSLLDSSGTTVASLSFPGGTSSTTRLSTLFTPTAGANNYRISTPIVALGTLTCSTGRILVRQTGATKTKIYIPITGNPYATTDSVTTVAGGSIDSNTHKSFFATSTVPERYAVLHVDSTKFAVLDATAPYTFEAVTGTSSGTPEVALAPYGTVTAIVNSQVTGTTATGLVQASLTKTDLPDGDYTVLFDRISGGGGSTTYLHKAALWVKLGDLTRAEVYYRVSRLVSTTSSLNVDNARAEIDLSRFTSPTVYHEATGREPTVGTSSVSLLTTGTNDTGSTGSTISGSAIDYGSTVQARTRTSALSITSGDRYIPSYSVTSGTFENSCSFMVIGIQ